MIIRSVLRQLHRTLLMVC